MKKLSKKKIIINSIIIVVITILAIVYLFKNKSVTWEMIKNIAWWHYLVVFGFFLLTMFLWSTIDLLVYKTFTNKLNTLSSWMNIHVGHLGSNVTPFRSGHFPLMAYYQNSKGFSLNESMTGLVKCQIIYSITTIFGYILLLVYFVVNHQSIVWQDVNVPFWAIVLIGILFHSLVFGAICLLSFNKKLLNFFLKVLIKIITKFKKSFNKDEFQKNVEEKFILYEQEIKTIFKSFHRYILPCLIYLVFMILLGTAQYVSYLVISKEAFSIKQLFVFYSLNLAATYITNIIPIPGGVGTSEFMFMNIFNSVISSQIIGSVLVLWRVSTYFIPIIFEAIIYLIFSLRYNHKLIKEAKPIANEV